MIRNIEWRAATPADMPFLLSLRKLTMTEYLQRAAMPTDDEAHYQRIAARFEDAAILCDEDVCIGLLKLSRTGDAWHLHQIQILPGYQGNGIGEAVLSRMLDEARHAGATVSLNVLHGNPARRLYERLGFECVTETSRGARLMWRP
ncbi:GNAT family N-acetyltransferase [Burkholderia stagnalis]|uniref:GNAT family N-acetyltransferase n=1 Tax=Burkholderia stagnalis TaxID=1503054 RepID=UPI000753B9E5|nr:GNAT family N-acetyltransferase [Burkholderia stagnalis]KVO56981.1 GCN5 family acetyltransferase [Burkholderia stagnalis]KVP11262.1 GCN5 family acetyltransferase [Burkholderia stagnalis]KVW92501.1 GCN5 family acetyltransferase [Burkholderia stagnalis]KWH72496.1 GCN5 family acetyltransferase [Burkholderia stagnalis]